MKGKKLEMLVLVVAFIILIAALFLMYKGYTGSEENNLQAMNLVNRLFSLGFLVYIAYSYLLSTNLNKEIVTLESHVDNLKQEVSRKRETINKQGQEIKSKEIEISGLNNTNQKLETDVNATKKQLAAAEAKLKQALKENKPAGDGVEK